MGQLSDAESISVPISSSRRRACGMNHSAPKHPSATLLHLGFGFRSSKSANITQSFPLTALALTYTENSNSVAYGAIDGEDYNNIAVLKKSYIPAEDS
jgi:hypothetical protein